MDDEVDKALEPAPKLIRPKPAFSSVATGGLTLSAASLEPLVSWALNGFAGAPPATAPFLISAALITLGHGLYNIATTRRKQ